MPKLTERPVMPIVRVDNWVLFPSQHQRDRKMTLRERLMWRLGKRAIR